MTQDTFAANSAEIQRLQQRVAAQDKARRNRHAEARRQQALKKWQAEKASEGTQSARRIEEIARHRGAVAAAKTAHAKGNTVYNLPPANHHRIDTAAIKDGRAIISSPPPAAPQDTLAERFKAQHLATGQSDRKAIVFVVAVFFLCIVCAVGIPLLARQG